MLGCIDMLCYLIHASVAFNLGHELKLLKVFHICLKWIEKIQVGCLSHWSSFRDGSHSTSENPGKAVHDWSECLKLLTALGIGLVSLLSKAWQSFNPWQKHLLDIYCKIFIQMQVLSCRIDSWSNMLAALDHHAWIWLALLSFSYLLLLDHGWCFYFCWTKLDSSRLDWYTLLS